MAKCKVETFFNEDIIESLVTFQYEDVNQVLVRQVFDAREEGIRKALIEMGWTPPNNRREV